MKHRQRYLREQEDLDILAPTVSHLETRIRIPVLRKHAHGKWHNVFPTLSS